MCISTDLRSRGGAASSVKDGAGSRPAPLTSLQDRKNRERIGHVREECVITGRRERWTPASKDAERHEEESVRPAHDHDVDSRRYVPDGLGRLLSGGAPGTPGQR